jgi:hypothetical protein
MKRQLPAAVGVLCCLLLGVAAGFAHRLHHLDSRVRSMPVEHAAACLEALVHLRHARPAQAAGVLRRHRDRIRPSGGGGAGSGVASAGRRREGLPAARGLATGVPGTAARPAAEPAR